MNDKEIIEEWNPEPVTLGDILDFLETANHTDWYIWHVKDNKGVLWAVSGDWDGDRWFFGADPLDSPGHWFDGNQFLSRRYLDSQKETLSTSETLSLNELSGRISRLEAIIRHHNLGI
jgi:hypothetical protein